MNYFKNMTSNLKSHLVDSTAMMVESTPVFAAFETLCAGMSDETSIHARLYALGLTYLGGMGIAYSKGREVYRKILKITEKSKEKVQSLNDAVYTGLFNLAVSPIIYFISGARDTKEIIIGTLGTVLLGIANGAPMGYALDTFKDLTGLKDCKRPSYPRILQEMTSTTKKYVAAFIVAGSIATTFGIYALSSDKHEQKNLSNAKSAIELKIDVLEPKVQNRSLECIARENHSY